jgi:putative endonuclease
VNISLWPNLILDILQMKSIYYTYILECKGGKRYYGHTNNLSNRLTEHCKGKVRFTGNKLPVSLVYYEELKTRSDAFKRETQLKNGKTRKEALEKLIKAFPKAKCQGFNSQTLIKNKGYDLCRCHSVNRLLIKGG